ncbi:MULTISPECIES: flocculation-associated PEP-CTERM protein PepA [unclassified Ectothiorhodospira]|uniref:flocculation-associated PEP-CTERM protein PepA n=1 Tax=unclassified Ectothiorhodospira TaxID=2684909 RepID=UPI001EE8456B|nr:MULTISPECIES: flocculation-associated PEP-CTERM protein PepA [unclassified Ectothiorhodospira]MCG5517212.1 flocculation-associated PEP-CTERM protein PepA [Ectothiorhodospira sp. 9100]MCG5520132.1 flocculation-associated PEP-CTERM protein PepA [Ectothiorhodospira sp. 9905]
MIKKSTLLGTSMTLMLCSMAPLAQASIFEFNPSDFGGTDATYSGDELVGTFSTGFTSADAFATFSTTGWLRVDTINLNSSAVSTGGLNTDYQLWFEFSYDASGGTGGSIAPFYNIDAASFSLYAASGVGRSFNTATGGTGTPTVGDKDGTEVLLATGGDELFGGGVVNFQNQAFFGLDTDFDLVELGTFFTAPDPFYNLAFQSSSSVTPTLDFEGGTGTLNGTGEFRVEEVPEPASLALIGFGLLALGWTVTRRREGQFGRHS